MLYSDPDAVIAPWSLPFTNKRQSCTPDASVTVAEKVTAVSCVATTGVMVPTVGATVSTVVVVVVVVVDDAAAIVTVVAEPLPLLPTASTHTARTLDVPLMVNV